MPLLGHPVMVVTMWRQHHYMSASNKLRAFFMTSSRVLHIHYLFSKKTRRKHNMTSQLWWHKDWVRYKYSHLEEFLRNLLLTVKSHTRKCILKSIKDTSCVQLVETQSGHQTALTNRFSNAGGHAWSSVRAVIDSCWLIDWFSSNKQWAGIWRHAWAKPPVTIPLPGHWWSQPHFEVFSRHAYIH